MSLSQALSAAVSGVNTTQQGLSVIAGNVANANTPGYVEESINQVEVGTVGSGGTSVETTGINRNLNQLLQNQLWTETSGGSYADMTSTLYQQLQTDLRHAEFVDLVRRDLQQFHHRAAVARDQSRVVDRPEHRRRGGAGARPKSQFDDGRHSANPHPGRAGHQQRRTIGEHADPADRADQRTARGLVESDSAAAALEDQRDQDVTQLSQLMNVRRGAKSGQPDFGVHRQRAQLVASSQASQLSFDNAGTLSATAQWSADPSQDGVGTITLTVPGGSSTDLLADGAIQSGEIAAYVQMRDNILPQAQTQLDEMANQMSQALSNQTTSGTAVTSGGQAGYSVDVGSLLPGNTVTLSYTDGTNTQHTVTIVALGAGGSLPQSSANATNPVIGVDFSAGMGAVVSQLNAALGTNLQFSNPSGTVLQVLNNGGTQHRQFAVGDLDRDVVVERQLTAPAVYR